jgi:hypothetical protein
MMPLRRPLFSYKGNIGFRRAIFGTGSVFSS